MRQLFPLLALLAACAAMEVVQMNQMRALDDMEAELLDADAQQSRLMAGLKRISQGKNKHTDPIGDLSRELEMADDDRKRVDAKLAYEASQFDRAAHQEESATAVRAQEKKEESLERELFADLASVKPKQNAAKATKPTKKLAKGDDVSCMTKDHECDPKICLCRKGSPPVPLDKPQLAKMDNNVMEKKLALDSSDDQDTVEPEVDAEGSALPTSDAAGSDDADEDEDGDDDDDTTQEEEQEDSDDEESDNEDDDDTATEAKSSADAKDTADATDAEVAVDAKDTADAKDASETVEVNDTVDVDNSAHHHPKTVDTDGAPNHRQEGNEGISHKDAEDQAELDRRDHPKSKHTSKQTDGDGVPNHYRAGTHPPEQKVKQVKAEVDDKRPMWDGIPTKATNKMRKKKKALVSAFSSDWSYGN